MDLKRKASQPAEQNGKQPKISKRDESTALNTLPRLFRVDGMVALITGGGTGKLSSCYYERNAVLRCEIRDRIYDHKSSRPQRCQQGLHQWST